MNPDKPIVQTEQRNFNAAFTDITEWIEGQKRNRKAGRVEIDLEYLVGTVSAFFSALESMRMKEDDEVKKTELSEIEANVRKVVDGLASIHDLYEQTDDYVAAKRLLLEVHGQAKKFLSQ